MIPRYNVIKVAGYKYKINCMLRTQLDIMKNTIRDDFDAVCIVDGEIEGTGKSVLTQQMARYVDPTLNIDRIVFTPLEFKEAVLNADKYQAIIWDEAYEGANKFTIMSWINQMIRSLLRQIRQKNLFIFVVIPALTDLDWDIAVRRSWFLVRAKLKVNMEKLKLERGDFAFFSRARKKKLYYIEANKLDLKKGWELPNPSFVGFFEDGYCVDKQLYLEKKSEIRVNNILDERTFMEECIRRGMPYGNPIRLKDYVRYSEQHYYRIKKSLPN